MSEPTADEIARVKAWERGQAAERNAAAARAREAADQQERAKLQIKLAGRTIAYVDGEQDYGTWTKLRLVFADGGHVDIRYDGYDNGLDITDDDGPQCPGALLDRMRVVRDSDGVTLVDFLVPRGMNVGWVPPYSMDPWHWEREELE